MWITADLPVTRILRSRERFGARRGNGAVWRRAGIAAVLIAGLGLAGCQTVHLSDLNPFSGGDEPQPCPNAGTLADAVTITEFGRGTARDESNIIYSAKIERTHFECDVVGGQVRGRIVLLGTLTLGRKGQSGPVSLPIFVALTRNRSDVVSKRFDEIEFEVERGATTAQFEKAIDDYTFNVGGGETTVDYEILTGFNLTPEQIEYNRTQLGG